VSRAATDRPRQPSGLNPGWRSPHMSTRFRPRPIADSRVRFAHYGVSSSLRSRIRQWHHDLCTSRAPHRRSAPRSAEYIRPSDTRNAGHHNGAMCTRHGGGGRANPLAAKRCATTIVVVAVPTNSFVFRAGSWDARRRQCGVGPPVASLTELNVASRAAGRELSGAGTFNVTPLSVTFTSRASRAVNPQTVRFEFCKAVHAADPATH